jgi:hypothetical protein
LQLLGAIKGSFVVQSLNFFLHLVWQLLFWLEAVRVTQVWHQLLREVLESRRLGFLLTYPSHHPRSFRLSISLFNSLSCLYTIFLISFNYLLCPLWVHLALYL